MGLNVRTQVRAWALLSFSVAGVSSIPPLTQRDELERIEVQCMLSVSGRSVTHLSLYIQFTVPNTFASVGSGACL